MIGLYILLIYVVLQVWNNNSNQKIITENQIRIMKELKNLKK